MEVENDCSTLSYSARACRFENILNEKQKDELIEILGLNSIDVYPGLSFHVINGASNKLITPLNPNKQF
ncbi:hypothetical protein V8G69_15475 [Gaetbulibacter sp. M235]|uniref:hypothetical protein n=1 Tax=Gaetbulibacter sp. M235 TaxID=3126510 RepID=UPI00374FAE88